LAGDAEGGAPIAGFREHLLELRARVKVILISLISATLIFLAFPANPVDLLSPRAWQTGLYKPLVSLVLDWIRENVKPDGVSVISLSVGAPLEIYLLASLLLGLIASGPVIAYEIYRFVDPALYPHERRALYPFLLSFTGLFLAGAAFGLFYIARFVVWTVIPFSQFVGATPVLSVNDFYVTVFLSVALTGLAFTFPAFFVLLVKFGIVRTTALTSNRKLFYPILYIIVAVITPDGGPLADIALFLPLAAMMELSVLVARRYEAQRAAPCPFCGAKLLEQSLFCPRCGRALV
jgi:sec-independent protein translocase protein TatC